MHIQINRSDDNMLMRVILRKKSRQAGQSVEVCQPLWISGRRVSIPMNLVERAIMHGNNDMLGAIVWRVVASDTENTAVNMLDDTLLNCHRFCPFMSVETMHYYKDYETG